MVNIFFMLPNIACQSFKFFKFFSVINRIIHAILVIKTLTICITLIVARKIKKKVQSQLVKLK